ncbi:hypothetical protein KKE60_04195 [Patescibacteria group bacterium]|nr:hypothetical protein [Patescibacteria group bacterium]
MQKLDFRTIYVNPNNLYSASYPGEKVYQAQYIDSDEVRWWKNVSGAYWQLIAGTTLWWEWEDDDGYIRSPDYAALWGGDSAYGLDTDEFFYNTWTAVMDYPAPARRVHAGASVKGKGYSFAGIDPEAVTEIADNDEFDEIAWTSKTDLPVVARSNLAASYIGSKGYVFGGNNAVEGAVIRTDEYDPSTDAWDNKTDFPDTMRWKHAAATINNKAYVFCGVKAGATRVKDTYEYDDDTWTSKTDAPDPARQYLAAAGVDYAADPETPSYIAFIAGGEDAGGALQDCDYYIASIDTWGSATNMSAPARRNLAASALYETYLYIYGGDLEDTIKQDCDQYDLDEDAWTAQTDVPLPARTELAAVTGA